VSFHHRAVRERLVALDVGDPQTIRLGANEVAVDKITGCRHLRSESSPGTARKALQTRALHEHLDGIVADGDRSSDRQFGMHTTRAVGAAEALCTSRMTSVNYA
jgi:hypothetical protein